MGFSSTRDSPSACARMICFYECAPDARKKNKKNNPTLQQPEVIYIIHVSCLA